MSSSSSTAAATRPNVKPASRFKLFAAMMYEGVLLFAVVFIAAFLFDTLTQSRSGLQLHWQRQFVVLIAIGIYFVLCWYRRQQTVAMKAWHLKLIALPGRQLTLARLVLRYVLCWPIPLLGAFAIEYLTQVTGWPSFYMFIVFCPFLNLLASVVNPQGLLWHDWICGTRIVDVKI
ncbi:RDD family protein [Brackiella oedipodis]|uniref:RDD family protein n=1 Tax=Brackiella oedipodis TaxID=124225 RepID=UPI00049218D7|nr:RDD family protein [Brackiella oedipodis]